MESSVVDVVDITPPKSKPKKRSKDKEKHKGKAKAKDTSQHGRNEGIDPNWAYAPPPGMVVLDTAHMDEAFDWEAVRNDENKELWIMRVPVGFKLKQLEGLQIQQPSNSPGTKLTTLSHKRAVYDVWAADRPLLPAADMTVDDAARPTRAEEIMAVSCLLPRKRKSGRLYISPKPISQHIIITHAPAAPQPDVESAPAPSMRHRVPKHLLKHRFMPYGAASSDNNVVGHGKEEISEGVKALAFPERTPKKISSSPRTPASKKSKKRKDAAAEDETPKRSKKPKI